MPNQPHKLRGYADLHQLTEDERIQVIGEHVVRQNEIIGVCVDAQPGKAGRYVKKLRENFPQLEVFDVFDGPTPGVVTIKVGPRQHDRN